MGQELGGYLKEVRHLAGQAVVRQDWATGRSSELAQRAAVSAGSLAGEMIEHGEHMGRRGPPAGAFPRVGAYDDVDRMVPTVAALRLSYPVLVTPPMTAGGPWSARSDAQDRPLRVNLLLDPRTGAVANRQDFGQRDWVDRVVGVGVAAHEGQLFGWPNQILNLFTATGLLTVSASAVVLWLRRRPGGRLGAPVPAGAPRFAPGLLAIVIVLGVLLPLLGASLVAMFVLERTVLARLPGVAAWLGLRPHSRADAAVVAR